MTAQQAPTDDPYPARAAEHLSPLVRARRTLSALASDPAEFYERLAGEVREWPERRRPIRPYVADLDWDANLHAHFGASTPCAVAAEIAPMWDDVLADMTRRGVATGPMSYLGWNDGDPGLVRAVWCLIRHLKATKVVETGVAHGLTSRFVLEALAGGGVGHLWSIDLPPMLHPEVHDQIGVAVSQALRGRWTYIKGSSRRRLPALLKMLGPIDLFIHDSKHSADNVLFELRSAWLALRPGGAVVVDDIDANNGFHRFCETTPHHRAWICEAEPIRPDERRANRKGVFGVIIKAS
jgi:methyltransferase family protein